MTENFLIGIGGTGARVLEAFVHCCAAGFGGTGFGPDEEVHLLLVDPDEANGNLARTTSLITQYVNLRQSLREERTLEAGNHAFSTKLVVPEAGLVWSVLGRDKQGQRLDNYINYNNLSGPLKAAAELLFTKKELETDLNEGFRGHPSIGAVVMADPPLTDPGSPLRVLTAKMSTNKSARVFMVGSIFGGTGAAGFPTLGKVLKKDMGGKWSQLVLGGALVLPYFSFVAPAEAADGKMFVKASDFPAATAAALRYYDKHELAFDQYYFVGDSLDQEVGDFSPGTKEQNNLPHYVELASALAAFDFFGQALPAADAGKQYFAASRSGDEVGWNDLPTTRNTQPEKRRQEFREAISSFTLFCYVYLKFGLPVLQESHDAQRQRPWFRKSFNDRYYATGNPDRNPGHVGNKDLLQTKVSDYAQLFLKWVTDLSAGRGVRLVDNSNLLKGAAGANPSAKLRFDPATLEDLDMKMGRLFHGYPTKDKESKEGKDKGFDQFVRDSLNYKPVEDDTQNASEKYINVFFRAVPHFLGFEQAAAGAAR